MSSFTDKNDLKRNGQDSTERHGFSELTFGEGGAVVNVQGNGTEDNECVVLSVGGTIMNLPKGTNAEVIMLGGGDDTNAKFAIVVGPRDKQYKSKPGEAWTQDPLNPDKRVGFTPNGVRVVSDGSIGIGNGGQVEVRDGKVYLRGQIFTEQPIQVGTVPYTP